MAKLTFILGLSGSGKTYLSERLKKTGAEVFTNLLADENGLTSLIAFLRDGKDCIVDEVRFCACRLIKTNPAISFTNHRPRYALDLLRERSRAIGMSSIGHIKAIRKDIWT